MKVYHLVDDVALACGQSSCHVHGGVERCTLAHEADEVAEMASRHVHHRRDAHAERLGT